MIMAMSIIIGIFLSILMAAKTGGVYCPYYCRCFMLKGYRQVECVGRGIITVELDVPRTVQWLQLSNNSIYELRDNIFEDLGLEHLVQLNLDNNAIQSIGLNAFSGLKHLQHIDLSGNHLHHILPGTFANSPTLTYLNLRGNPLRYIRDNQPFLISDSLSVLDVSNCRLNYIPETSLNELPSLVKLNISSNHLSSITYYTFDYLSRLRELDVSNNRLQCDFATKDLFSWLESRHIQTSGSPCHIEHPVVIPKVVSPMLERMVIQQNDMISSDNELDDYTMNPQSGCYCDQSKPDESVEMKSYHNEVKDTKEEAHNKSYNPLFLLLAFVNGLIVGMAFSLSFWIGTRCIRAKRARRRLANYSNIQSESPPPAYSDLF